MSANIATALIVVAALAILVAGAVVLVMISRMSGRNRGRAYRLELANLGNVSGQYELNADEPGGALLCQFMLSGTPLPTTLSEGAPATLSLAATTGSASTGAGGVQQAGGLAAMIADVVGTIGYSLPASAGGSQLLSLAQTLRGGSYAADRASDLGRQLGSTPSAGPPARAPATQTQSASTAVAWAHTPVVEAGATLPLEVRVNPARPGVSGTFQLRITSRLLERPDLPPVIATETIALSAPSLLTRIFPLLAFIVLVTFVIACSAFLIYSRALVGA